MSFTDDMLRIYKNIVLPQTAPIYVSHSELESLLARLEAAEHVIEVTFDSVPELIDMDSYKAWLKSKGEAGK